MVTPRTGRVTVLPDWGAKDLKLGTLRAAVRQLGIDWQTFEQA
jgi:mRNA interferase HicA